MMAIPKMDRPQSYFECAIRKMIICGMQCNASIWSAMVSLEMRYHKQNTILKQSIPPMKRQATINKMHIFENEPTQSKKDHS